MGESNIQNTVPFQNPAPKRSNQLSQMSPEQLANLGTLEAEAELTRRWSRERFGVDESE